MPEKCIKDHAASADASVAHLQPNQTKLTKMKSMILVALALVAVAAAAPAVEEPIPIIRSEIKQEPQGGYQYNYETGNGISAAETGEVKQVLDEENKPHDVVVVRGSFSYTSPDGKPITIEYVADETGFHPQGESIPKVTARR